jgi:hypothetical protein
MTLTLCEVAVLLGLALRRPRARRRTPVRLALAVVRSFLLVGALTATGTAGAVTAMPAAFDTAPLVPGRPAVTVDLLTEAPGAQPVRSFTLTAEVSRIGGRQAWTYDGSVPGPELRVRQGDRLRVTLVNHLPAATTIHWHGVPGLPNAEDGVAGITQQAVPPGRSMTYEFVAREPGTDWYHSHQDTGTQLALGLYGALVVEPRTGPAEDVDYTAVLHSGLDGGFEVNGHASDVHVDTRPGQTVRLRLVDAVVPGMDGGPETPVLVGAPHRVVALDGRDLNGPAALGPERLPIGMGQRLDVVFTMPAGGAVRLYDRLLQGTPGGVQRAISNAFKTPPQADTVTVGSGPVPAPGDLGRLPLFDTTRYGTPAADPVAAAPATATRPVVIGAGRLPRRPAGTGAHDQRPGLALRATDRNPRGRRRPPALRQRHRRVPPHVPARPLHVGGEPQRRAGLGQPGAPGLRAGRPPRDLGGGLPGRQPGHLDAPLPRPAPRLVRPVDDGRLRGRLDPVHDGHALRQHPRVEIMRSPFQRRARGDAREPAVGSGRLVSGRFDGHAPTTVTSR